MVSAQKNAPFPPSACASQRLSPKTDIAVKGSPRNAGDCGDALRRSRPTAAQSAATRPSRRREKVETPFFSPARRKTGLRTVRMHRDSRDGKDAAAQTVRAIRTGIERLEHGRTVTDPDCPHAGGSDSPKRSCKPPVIGASKRAEHGDASLPAQGREQKTRCAAAQLLLYRSVLLLSRVSGKKEKESYLRFFPAPGYHEYRVKTVPARLHFKDGT